MSSRLRTDGEHVSVHASAEPARPRCRERVPALLARLRLAHGAVDVHSTPRRLAVAVARVAARQQDIAEAVRGPPAKARPVAPVLA